MKKLLLSMVLAVSAVCSFGQGQIIMGNSSGNAITNSVTGLRAATTTRVGFYANANTAATTGDTGWVLAGGTTNLTAAGIFLGGTRTFTGFPAGTPAAIQVRAWLTTGNFASYEDALVGEPGGLFGVSSVYVITPANAPSPIPTLAAAGFQSFNIAPVVPEPSTIALGLLGLGAVALFRRRK